MRTWVQQVSANKRNDGSEGGKSRESEYAEVKSRRLPDGYGGENCKL